jgi:hypothetical protein
MKTILAAAIAAITILASVDLASAQGVRPQFNYQGQAVCPEGYDYVGSLCRPLGYSGREYYRGRTYGGGEGVPPRWNRRGSAVCPEGYDFHAHSGLCRPQ